jgi:hypothetical protein
VAVIDWLVAGMASRPGRVSRMRKTPANTTRILRLEPAAQRSHNRRGAHDDGKPDRRIVALVRLLARLAAEEDFRREHDER